MTIWRIVFDRRFEAVTPAPGSLHYGCPPIDWHNYGNPDSWWKITGVPCKSVGFTEGIRYNHHQFFPQKPHLVGGFNPSEEYKSAGVVPNHQSSSICRWFFHCKPTHFSLTAPCTLPAFCFSSSKAACASRSEDSRTQCFALRGPIRCVHGVPLGSLWVGSSSTNGITETWPIDHLLLE